MTTTPNLALTLPTVGASRDTWGTVLNDDLTTLDSVMPVGAVLDFAGPAAPSGWLLCDGSLISRTTYSDLFAAIGTAWGAGDGSTTFKLPSHAGRAAIGTGAVTDAVGHTTGFAFGQLTGQVGNYVQQVNLPNVSLTSSATGAHTHNAVASTATDHTHTGTTDNTPDAAGGAHSHTYFSPQRASGPVIVAAGTYPLGDLMDTSSTPHTHHFTTDPAGAHTHAVAMDSQGNHSHTVSLGGGAQLMSVLSPVIVMTKIIFAGKQGITATTLADTPSRRTATPLRGSH